MVDLFISDSAFARQLPYFDFGGHAPTWLFLAAFVVLMVGIDLYRLRRAHARVGQWSVSLATLIGSLGWCVIGLAVSLLLGMSVMLLGRVVILGLGSVFFGMEQNPESGPAAFTWAAFVVSLIFALLMLVLLRDHTPGHPRYGGDVTG